MVKINNLLYYTGATLLWLIVIGVLCGITYAAYVATADSWKEFFISTVAVIIALSIVACVEYAIEYYIDMRALKKIEKEQENVRHYRNPF